MIHYIKTTGICHALSEDFGDLREKNQRILKISL